jgi:hypothetical protein
MNEVATQKSMVPAELQEKVLLGGDLQKLSPNERLSYYNGVCTSLGLNPLTRPFEYITLNGKLTLYARKDCTEQLRSLRGVSVAILSREIMDGMYVVTARASDHTGRTDESIGAVAIEKMQGEAKANAMMKAETKAKRRVTLSFCGLGMLDESEVEGHAPTITATVDNGVSAYELAEKNDEELDQLAEKLKQQQEAPASKPTAAPSTAPVQSEQAAPAQNGSPKSNGNGSPLTPDEVWAKITAYMGSTPQLISMRDAVLLSMGAPSMDKLGNTVKPGKPRSGRHEFIVRVKELAAKAGVTLEVN